MGLKVIVDRRGHYAGTRGSTMITMRDRYRGCLLGGAVGDALE